MARCGVPAGLIAAMSLLIAGCGSGSSGSGEPPAPPVTVGLDERPANPDCVAPVRPGSTADTVSVTRVFPALAFVQPVLALQAPGDSSRWFVVEQGGRVVTFANVADASVTSPFIDITARVVSGGERGLLGMAFDPQFATTGRVFVNYTRGPTALQTVIASYVSRDGGLTLDPSSEQVLLTIDQPFNNHNGGNLVFGPDGLLYAGLGDGGSGGDPQNNAQNTRTLLGKMLRIDVSAATGYTIPAANPFAGNARCTTGSGADPCPESFARGFRNPWRFSFDRATGDLWVGDVGQNAWEEVDRVVAGGNYGWRFREGAHCYNPATGCPTAHEGQPLIDPVAEYDHAAGASITGGYVYRGAANPGLVGRYVFADFISGRVFAHDPGSSSLTPVTLAQTSLSISSFAQDQDGVLYIVDYSGGLYRVDQPVAGDDTIPVRLSETGCVSAGDATQPAAGLIPYAPNAESWSDGADKTRWLAVPDGQDVAVTADGDWEFPSASVLVQNFSLQGRLVETRLLMRHPDGVWAGYSYEWNDGQTDATRVIGGKRQTFGSQDWIYPSESECLRCHTEIAGRTLGLETAQLNGTLLYPQTGRSANQLDTLDAIGVLSPPLSGGSASLPRYADPADTSEPLDARARAWLHTNCSGCHRPGGPTPSSLDLRHDTALSATAACDAPPQHGDLGIVDARLIAPGAPDRSVLLARVARRDASAMPPLASLRVDEQATALLGDWIASLASCD
jgi:uncharacterized repeat protein (TIGR03806 family)